MAKAKKKTKKMTKAKAKKRVKAPRRTAVICIGEDGSGSYTPSKPKKAKSKPKPKKRYLIRELTAFIESKGPDKVSFKECQKLAKQIKPDTTFNEVYFKILVGRIRSNLKKK